MQTRELPPNGYIGKLCKRGHDHGGGTIRYKTGLCIECSRMHGYNNAQKPESKIRKAETERIRWLKHKDILTKNNIAWAKNNPKKAAEHGKKWKTKNKERVSLTYKEWGKRNKGLVTAKSEKRRAMKARALPAWADIEAIKNIYKESQRISRETGVKHHVDHIIPLINKHICGLHVESNLRIITAEENFRKSNKVDMEVLCGQRLLDQF